MARSPIRERRGFFSYINRNLKLTRDLDCNAVETELGTMVEPRNLGFNDGRVLNGDPVDEGYNSVTLMDSGTFYNQYGSYITQRPSEFNY